MSKALSPYYPPRARWYRPRVPLGFRVRRRLLLSRLHRRTVSLAGVLASCVIPGLAFYMRTRLWGGIAMAASALLTVIFFVELGHFAANAAFGLLLAIHATGLNYLAEPWLREVRFRFRVLLSMLILLALGGILYLPARAFLENNFFTPWRPCALYDLGGGSERRATAEAGAHAGSHRVGSAAKTLVSLAGICYSWPRQCG